MEWHEADCLVLRAAAEAERLRRTKLYSHLRQILIRMVLEVSVHRREQREMEAALRESMEVSDAFGAVPASRAAIDALEKTKLREVSDYGDDGCVICKDEISREEEAARMPCKHIFHHECIVRWLNASNLCPLCRFPMPGDCD
ncbi:E3 ubiquitin-protein ligase SGR9, amyloplastic-like [Syzygium oleosum]|uniref:E3 ubiquitin-protein ligase SGR9, amyloplastic-like n=1 Tax=Syzygium oleosum TaxID=219896 RepID=UPI0024B92E81|nr:E3 ubiquitin-protein ligase SGR9, amyloplastic-like [Syzygium oleosum]